MSTSSSAVHDASRAFGLVFQDDVAGARAQLEANLNAAYNHVALGFISFVEAMMGMEEQFVVQALDSLFKAEEAIKKAKATMTSSPNDSASAAHWWTPGLEYDIMLADVLILQSILHFMTESSVESMKGIYKSTRAYKIFSASYQAVFSQCQFPNSTPSSISSHPDDIVPFIDSIQQLYSEPKPHPSTLVAPPTSYLSSLSLLPFRSKKSRVSIGPAKSAVVSPYKSWADDPIAVLVIGGSAYGYGIFGLILTFLPSKVKKLLSWVGFNGATVTDRRDTMRERNRCIRWLLFATVGCQWEMHGKLAGLSLLSYRTAMLMAVGWQAARDRSIAAYSSLVDTMGTADAIEDEQGTLWILNKSRLFRLRRDVEAAKNLLMKRINWRKQDANASKFKQADVLLGYEIALVRVSLGEWMEAGEAFLTMKKHNAWSHVTYQFAAVGCFLLVEDKSEELGKKIGDLFEELPALLSKKRVMTPPTEALVTRKLKQYKARHAELAAQGLVPPDRLNCYWDSIQISPIEEFSLLMAIYDHSPESSLCNGIDRLCGLTPQIEIDYRRPSSHPKPIPQPQASKIGLSKEEMAMRDILLGTQLLSLGEFREARKALERVELEPNEEPYNYITALIQRALVELKEADQVFQNDEKHKHQDVQNWKIQLEKASNLLNTIIDMPENFPMRGRIESRVQLIKDEIDEKKDYLGISF